MADEDYDEDGHRDVHETLHRHLDELVADMIRHVPTFRPSKSTVLELLTWSKKQTEKPDRPQ